MAIFVEGSIWETMVFAVGGNHITNDIAVGLRTPFAIAEDIKVRYAHAVSSAVDEEDKSEITPFGDNNEAIVTRRKLCDIAALRTEEMFDLIAREIRRSGFGGLLPAGVVLTGGSAGLTGIRQVAEQVLQLPVRIGAPRRLQGLIEAISSPAYATSVGLLIWGMREEATSAERGPKLVTNRNWYQRLMELFRMFLPRG
jgi:cell division protein FtsA